ncbi:uncharacterized protein LOC111028339 [Myzus persicae]|uniref:uncharacterized protein LOC111028339 n=1 Tax=Myzus persicae TaxID=13164 RepID=UPI000B935574|nr:uncharacterized protein LOC111028339 [Myzus persicae]
MSREKESQCIEDFINIYRSEHCLWKIKSREYHDKCKRDAAHKLLVENLKEIDSSATKSVVVKKINNLRSSYRKELKKVKESTRTGSGADDVYQPKLWYFNILSFLDDQDTPRNSRSNIESDDENSVSECHLVTMEIDIVSTKRPSEREQLGLPNQRAGSQSETGIRR